MKSIIDVIYESIGSAPTPAVAIFYRANVGKQCEDRYGDMKGKSQIGEVTEISFKYYSNYDKSFTFGEPRGTNNWIFAIGIDAKDNDTTSNFEKFLNRQNKEDKFFQWFTDKNEAIKVATKAKREYDSQKWTLKSLLTAIKKDRDLMSLRYDYHIAKTSSQVDNTPIESIYVSGSWRITVVDGKIHVKRAGWHIYEVPNLASLYKVLAADSGSDEDETIRQNYAAVV
jgi:hypothetical protein